MMITEAWRCCAASSLGQQADGEGRAAAHQPPSLPYVLPERIKNRSLTRLQQHNSAIIDFDRTYTYILILTPKREPAFG